MQGKGIVKFFLVVLAIVCIYQYSLIIPTNRVEANAAEYAENEKSNAPAEEQETVYRMAYASYLDSVSNKEVFKVPLLPGMTYQDLKEAQLNLGLDLKGGMSVVLQVDLREFIENLANDPKYENLQKALDLATKNQQNTQANYVSLFVDAWNDVTDEPLRDAFRRSDALKDKITATTSDGEMARILREKADETVKLTFEMLKKRIDRLGVVQPNISLDEARDLILVELPGIDNPERARAFLTGTAKLEFWNVFRIQDNNLPQSLVSANDRLQKEARLKSGKQTEIRIDTTYVLDTLGNATDQIAKIDSVEVTDPNDFGPLFSIFTPNQGQMAPAVIGVADKNNKEEVIALLEQENIKNLFPKNLKWLWERETFETDDGREMVQLYAIKKDRNSDKAPLSGEVVQEASAGPNPQTNEVEVSLSMNGEGARKWGKMTTAAYNDSNRPVAIALDDEVVSAPRVNSPITGGRTSITGQFSVQEANDLAQILQVGKLPASAEIIQESVVGPSLGAKNIQNSLWAISIGFLLVFVFMIFYYGSAGVVSVISLFLNLFFIFGALASLGTVLTVPGIAGIVLTIGMAVDANVIIFERIREELREGKSLRAAIADGFANSYSAIIDANVTTILTAIVLAYFGLGPIKGFAVVLIVGVILSVFTAVLVGRLLIDWWVGRGNNISFWTGASKSAFANLNIDWLGKRRTAYMISGTIIVLGIASMLIRGWDLGVDFTGGYSYNVQFAQDVKADQIREALADPFGAVPTVKTVDTDNTFNIVTKYNIESTEKNAADVVTEALYKGVSSIPGVDVSLKDFRAPETTDGITHITASSKVGPTIADDIQKSSIYAAIFALLGIFLYIFLRFNKWQYSMGAVAALFHDTLVVLGLFSILWGFLPFTMELDQAFIAAILTVIGYSINDTVVVFDRIREYLNIYTGDQKEVVINRAINSTVSRTVITSLTTLFVVLIMFLFGGGSIKGFAFALLIGIVVGTYSSIFIATPVMSDLTGDLKPKRTKERKSFSKAVNA